MGKRHHVIFTGTGRSGTTFIIALLTKLGLDTGYSDSNIDQHIDKNGRAGLEGNIRLSNAPYIVKSPNISNYIESIITDPKIVLDHVFIPIRDIEAAALSRSFVSKTAIQKKPLHKRIFPSSRGHAGGLIRTRKPKKQEAILLKSLSNLLVGIASTSVPVTFIHYPKLTQNPTYLFDKLRTLIDHIPYRDFESAYEQTIIPEWVHQFTDKDT